MNNEGRTFDGHYGKVKRILKGKMHQEGIDHRSKADVTEEDYHGNNLYQNSAPVTWKVCRNVGTSDRCFRVNPLAEAEKFGVATKS
jgi:hypothetical protein